MSASSYMLSFLSWMLVVTMWGHFHNIIGEFGIVYKAHIVKHKDGQVITETMAVKTLKGELKIIMHL